MTSWRARCFLHGLFNLFQGLLYEAQPVLVLLLVQHELLFTNKHHYGCLPTAITVGIAIAAEGLFDFLHGKSYSPAFIQTGLAVLLTCIGPLVLFLVKDVTIGFGVGSCIYGLGVGLCRSLTSNARDELEVNRKHLNRQAASVLGGFVGGPLLLIFEDILGIQGAILLLAGVGLHAIVPLIVQFRDNGGRVDLPSKHLEAARSHHDDDDNLTGTLKATESVANEKSFAIELQPIEPPALPLSIDGKIPFFPQRKHQSQEFGYRDRVNSVTVERHPTTTTATTATSKQVERPTRRRLYTEPANADLNYNSIKQTGQKPERSVSVDVLHRYGVLHTVFHRRSVSQESISILTPIELPIPPLEALKGVLTTPSFSFLLFSFVSNCNLWMVSTTMLNAYVDKADKTQDNPQSMFIMAICLYLAFALANVLGIFSCDTFLRCYDTSEKTVVTLTNFIGGFTLLMSPFVHSVLGFALWAGILGAVHGSLLLIQPNILRIYLGARLQYYGLAISRILCGIYLLFGLPLFVHYYRDSQATYDLLYQIFGLLQLGVTFLWLFLEPFFEQHNFQDEEILAVDEA